MEKFENHRFSNSIFRKAASLNSKWKNLKIIDFPIPFLGKSLRLIQNGKI
jgi:hypothetical protein